MTQFWKTQTRQDAQQGMGPRNMSNQAKCYRLAVMRPLGLGSAPRCFHYWRRSTIGVAPWATNHHSPPRFMNTFMYFRRGPSDLSALIVVLRPS